MKMMPSTDNRLEGFLELEIKEYLKKHDLYCLIIIMLINISINIRLWMNNWSTSLQYMYD